MVLDVTILKRRQCILLPDACASIRTRPYYDNEPHHFQIWITQNRRRRWTLIAHRGRAVTRGDEPPRSKLIFDNFLDYFVSAPGRFPYFKHCPADWMILICEMIDWCHSQNHSTIRSYSALQKSPHQKRHWFYSQNQWQLTPIQAPILCKLTNQRINFAIRLQAADFKKHQELHFYQAKTRVSASYADQRPSTNYKTSRSAIHISIYQWIAKQTYLTYKPWWLLYLIHQRISIYKIINHQLEPTLRNHQVWKPFTIYQSVIGSIPKTNDSLRQSRRPS